MLAELESNRLEVALMPEKRRTHEMGMIRVATAKNATWYQKFCARHPSSRGTRRGGFDTRIRRANVLRSLERLIAGKSTGKYGQEFLRLAAQIETPPSDPTMITKTEVENVIREVERQNGVLSPHGSERVNLNERQLFVLLEATKMVRFTAGCSGAEQFVKEVEPGLPTLKDDD